MKLFDRRRLVGGVSSDGGSDQEQLVPRGYVGGCIKSGSLLSKYIFRLTGYICQR